jgi:hypothetical protein
MKNIFDNFVVDSKTRIVVVLLVASMDSGNQWLFQVNPERNGSRNNWFHGQFDMLNVLSAFASMACQELSSLLLSLLRREKIAFVLIGLGKTGSLHV